ncbi:class I SAM-dependent methyltransferase [Streptomyces aquilus]|uniref:class I SAM-dependent methyltransferase n=1 Tax=Streptomyces aquilus TaxID=2548456 RepID=UPI00368AE77B
MRRDPIVEESVGWDTVNWSRALAFWLRRTHVTPTGLKALEVGAGGTHGNLSLWLADQGFSVVCSGLEEPSAALRRCHTAHGVGHAVVYRSLDVLQLPYSARFDVVVFKSLLGAFGMAEGDTEAQQRTAVRNMWEALRPGGELWFAEGVRGSRVHDVLRRRFGWGRRGWRYDSLAEIDMLFAPFEAVDTARFGVLGLFGRSERQRRVLGAFDKAVCERFVPETARYLVAGVARKGASGY